MRPDWRLFAAVAIGGAVGSVARFGLGSFLQSRTTGPFPVGTFVVNVVGSLLIGLFVQLGAPAGAMSVETRLLLTTGFCGGFTTFSTFSIETMKLFDDRRYAVGALYVGASVVLSLVATIVGMRAGARFTAGS